MLEPTISVLQEIGLLSPTQLQNFFFLAFEGTYELTQYHKSISISHIFSKTSFPGFPGGAVVESLPANAGDTGSRPGLGRSHMPRSNWAREPQLLSLRVWSLCSPTREATIVRGPRTAMKSGPRLPQLEKALAEKRRPNIAINQSINQSLKKNKKNKKNKKTQAFLCIPQRS